MALNNAIQFRGTEAVLKAYQSNGVPAWALFCSNEILFQYTGDSQDEGQDLLEQWLEMLKAGHSSSPYQLRIYFSPDGPITNKTPHNLSFKFTLFADEESGSVTGLHHVRNEIVGRLEKLEKRFDQEDGQEDPGIMGSIYGMLKNPEVQTMIMQKIMGWFGGGRPAAAAAGGTIGAVEPPGQTPPIDTGSLYAGLPVTERANLDRAMEILLSKDPNVGTNLLKVAQILERDPGKYKAFAAML